MKQLKVLESDLVNEWCMPDGSPLDDSDRQLLERFIDKYYRAKSKVTVYRGTFDVSRYGVDLDNIGPLSDMLFMLGEKANRYARDNDWKFDINDVSDNVFAELFDRLHEIFTSSAEPERYTSRKEFLKENPGIKGFFEAPGNKDKFLKKIKGLACRADVKDYYVALLHAFDAGRQFPACYMISTSKKYEQALSFLRGKTKKDEGILIISWVPSSEQDRFLKYQDLNECNKQIESLDLPVYKSSPFPEEDEICIKAIIPPQYILGYIHTEKKAFIPNPNLIEMVRTLYHHLDRKLSRAEREDTPRGKKERDPISAIITEGIPIDQSAFMKRFEEAKFTGYAYIEGEGKYKEVKRDHK
ncbi:hypothetical protein [uncultured Porphyromonas sp.]|uniref:hypothetical protein n=1 Tax=uncultured Porphyromonas sp. TaxID=159274 RepID=UPI002628AF76|nr:hypothetical protein [uncultured Porphyromonas sp.]